MVHDMTQEKPLRLFLSFGIPVLFGSLLQQLYSVIDSMVVGRVLGVEALAAIGSVSVLYFLVLGFIRGVCNGFAISVSQAFGAGDMAAVRRYVTEAFCLSGLLGCLMTILAMLSARLLLHWLHIPEDVFQSAYQYIQILFAGILILFLYNLPTSMLRAMGDSRTPLYFLILSSFLNILLDLILIVGLQTGTAGAAVATVAAQLVSGLLCFFYMKRKFPIQSLEKTPLSAAESRELLFMGIPLGLQFSFTSLGSIVLQSAVNSLGSGIVAATSIGGRLSSLFAEPMEAIAVTIATFTGQNLGAGRNDRIKSGVRQALFLGAAYSVAAELLLATAGETLALLFFDAAEAEVLADTGVFLLANGIGYPLLSSLFILRSALQGLGRSVLSMLAGIMEMAVHILIAFFFVAPFGYAIICYTNLLAWAAANLFLFPAFLLIQRSIAQSSPTCRPASKF